MKSLTDKTPIMPEDKEKLIALVEDIMEEEAAGVFMEPVDWKALDLPTYPTIIKKPMDLGTVLKNVKKGKFKTYHDLFNEIQLIWGNCKTFNVPESDIYELAQTMEDSAKKLIAKFRKEVGISQRKQSDEGSDQGSDSQAEQKERVSFDSKVNFTEKVRLLSNEGLKKLVKKIKEVCKSALEDVNSEKLNIKVDEIEQAQFDVLVQLVDLELKATKKAQGLVSEPPKKRQKTD